jgi:hypothetical protein
VILGYARLLAHVVLHLAQAISWSLSLDGAPPPDHMLGHKRIVRRTLSGNISRVECACGLVFWSRHPPGCAKCGRPFREHPVEGCSFWGVSYEETK